LKFLSTIPHSSVHVIQSQSCYDKLVGIAER